MERVKDDRVASSTEWNLPFDVGRWEEEEGENKQDAGS